ncbi:MAG: ABC transporter permease subunit [Proteobacteria bacterium]|nr:ABC transporter permease subunit [Pseudomonadota bacterium]
MTRAALNETLSPARRVRAIEILTELFDGVSPQNLLRFAQSRSADVRARAVWSYGRTHAMNLKILHLLPFLDDKNAVVRRSALETLVGTASRTDVTPVLSSLAKRLGDEDRFVRQTAARVVGQLDAKTAAALRKMTREVSARAYLASLLGRRLRRPSLDLPALTVAMQVLAGKYSSSNKRDAVRLMQLSLGDVGPRDKRPPVFDGYASRIDLSRAERKLDPFRIRIAKIFPSGDPQLDSELARVIAVLAPDNTTLLDKLLAKITVATHPVDDIHYLIAVSRIRSDRTAVQRKRLAAALVALETKIRKRRLKVDSNWDDRIGELDQQLAAIDPLLPAEVIHQPEFGRPEHVLFLNRLPKPHRQTAIDAFVRQSKKDREYPWTNELIFLLADSERKGHRELIRRKYNDFSVRNAVVVVLAHSPEQNDRPKFVRGLQAGQLEVLSACADALSKLPATKSPAEQFALLKTIRRLGSDRRDVLLRSRLVALLRRNSGQNFGFPRDANDAAGRKKSIDEWTRWLSRTFPKEAQRYLIRGGNDVAEMRNLLKGVAWNRGDHRRGEKLFRTRSCAQCHGGRRALGPDLAGAARRFSRDDLFTAILLPNRDVSPRYQTTLIQTSAGDVISGMVVYQSVDGLLMRFTDGVIALPLLPLLIVLAALDLEKVGLPAAFVQSENVSLYRIIAIVAVVGWTTVARLVRGAALTLREADFVLAAHAQGAGALRIMAVHILPNLISPIIVATTLSVGSVILLESVLSFLGLGIQPPIPSWGNLLTNAQELIWTAPALAFYPGILIFVTVIAFNFLGDGLQDALDPKAMEGR